MSKSEVSAAKHTPGPWFVGGRSIISQRITVFNRPFGLGDVAEVGHEDDARLIAAAPEMLEILKAISKALYIDDYGNWSLSTNFHADGIDHVIAKATRGAE